MNLNTGSIEEKINKWIANKYLTGTYTENGVTFTPVESVTITHFNGECKVILDSIEMDGNNYFGVNEKLNTDFELDDISTRIWLMG